MAEMEKKTVNAMGDVCPVPLVKAKNAIAELAGSGKVEVLVDNEIAECCFNLALDITVLAGFH